MPTELSEVNKDGKKEVKFNPLFPVLVGEILLDLPVTHIGSELIKLANKKTNWPGGWHSGIAQQKLDEVTGMRDANEAMYGVSVAFAQECKFQIDPQKGGVNAWACVTYGKSELIPRVRNPQATFSGVITIKEGTKKSYIALHNPNMVGRMHEPRVADPKDFNPYTAPVATLPLDANRLYVWPAWLESEVQVEKMTNGPSMLFFNVDFMSQGFQ